MNNVLMLDADQFVKLMFGYAGTLILVWGIYWAAVLRTKADPYAIVKDAGFLRIVTVGFTLCAVVILCLARVFSGELAASIVSGIVGYVLGSAKSSESDQNKDQSKTPHSPNPG